MKIRTFGNGKGDKQKIESPPMTFGQALVSVGLFSYAYCHGWDKQADIDFEDIEVKPDD